MLHSKIAKSVRSVSSANQKIDTKTGNRRQGPVPDRGTYESRLAEFLEMDEAYNPDDFKDILGKQHKEQEAAKKSDVKYIPSKNPNFVIRFRPQTDKLTPVKWQVLNQKEEIIGNGSSSNDKDAYNDAEDWIVTSNQGSSASGNVTINFNAAFARAMAPEGNTLWVSFWEGPIFVYSDEPQEGFKKTVIRTQAHARTAGAALLPVTTISPKEANKIGLKAELRYTLGPREELDSNVYGFPLIPHSRVEKGAMVPIKEPAIVTSAKVENTVDEDITPWGGYSADDKKAGALAKAPKSTMQGTDKVPFSQLVKDTIDAHGVKWAFDYYVKKHGLPPRQFKIFAGL
jgi:hypothetical protein